MKEQDALNILYHAARNANMPAQAHEQVVQAAELLQALVSKHTQPNQKSSLSDQTEKDNKTGKKQ